MTTETEPHSPFGLVATVAHSRVYLPLKGVKCAFTVAGGLAEVSMTQVYRQETDAALDCQYLFPLPADAAVHRCDIRVHDRLIRAQVEEREQARALARRKKQEGRRTVLVESERENLFTLSLGNVQPGDLLEVELTYFQPVHRTGERCALEVPFCPGVRYIPGRPLLRSNQGRGTEDDTDQVPDASRITPVRIDATHPDAAFIEVEGRLESRFIRAASVRSPSHALDITPGEGEVRVRLQDQAAVPDRGFVLRWEEQKAAAVTPRAWTCRNGAHTYALLELRAPETGAEVEPVPQDIYFLIDRSGSMEGMKWSKAVEALQRTVRALRPADRAMVSFFADAVQDFAEKPLPASVLLADPAFALVGSLGATGGTELAPALEHVLTQARRHSRSRRANLVLITDAQVGNDRGVLEALKNATQLPVHCFGVDVALNDALLLALTRQQGGTFHSVQPDEDIAAAVAALGRSLGEPVLLDPQLEGGWELAGRLSNLYAGEVQFSSARVDAEAPLRVTGRDAGGRPVTIAFEAMPIENSTPFLHWSRTRIQALLDADPANPQAVEVSKAANVICELTAFVAWDESERVVIAAEELVQPSLVPAACLAEDVSYCLAPATPAQDCEVWFDELSAMRGSGAESRAYLCERLADAFVHAGADRLDSPAWIQAGAVLLRWIFEDGSLERCKARIRRVMGTLEAVRCLNGQINFLRTQVSRLKDELRSTIGSVGSRAEALTFESRDEEMLELARRCEHLGDLGRKLKELADELRSLEAELASLMKPADDSASVTRLARTRGRSRSRTTPAP